jgi:hypothetical protein
MQFPRLIKNFGFPNLFRFHWKAFKFLNFSWFQWLVILAVLFLSALANRITNYLPLTFLIMAVGGSGFGLLALRNMSLALTLVLLSSATIGFTIGTGTATPLPFGLLAIAGLTAIWLLRMVYWDKRIYLKPSPLNFPLLAFLATMMLSWIVGSILWDWKLPDPKSNLVLVQAAQYALFVLSFAAAFLTAHQRLSQKDLQRWTWIVILMGILGMLYELATGSYLLRGLGVTGAILIWSVLLVGAQLLFNPELKGWMRLAGILSFLVWGMWAYRNLGWKGGWLPALIGLALLLLFKSRKIFLVGLLGATVLALTRWDTLVNLIYLPEIGTASTIRPLFWWDILRMTSRSLLLGLGPVNYKYFWEDPTFIPLSRIAAGWDTWIAWGYNPPSHNMFVDVFAQTGLIGFGLFVWGMIAAIWVVVQVARRLEPGFLRAHALGVLAGFISMLAASFWFADWLIPFVYNITITGFRHSVYSWILLGSVLGIYFNMQEKCG